MLLLARHLGLITVNAALHSFHRWKFCVIERYDRTSLNGRDLLRLHQEDFCQALGKSSHQKYEKEGGPSFLQCAQLVRRHSDLPHLL
jgi:serine/threonine-protein kinase HipA